MGELLDAGNRAAASTSETIGAAVGAAAGIALGIGIAVAAVSAAPVIPFLGVFGGGLGVLVTRGRSGILADRRRREQDLEFNQRLAFASALRAEAKAARDEGAPTDALQAIWRDYHNALEAPNVPKALPPGPPQSRGAT